jgi:hypothetical protein
MDRGRTIPSPLVWGTVKYNATEPPVLESGCWARGPGVGTGLAEGGLDSKTKRRTPSHRDFKRCWLTANCVGRPLTPVSQTPAGGLWLAVLGGKPTKEKKMSLKLKL